MSDPTPERLLGVAGPDPGCDGAFDQLDRYCDAVLRGEEVTQRFEEFLRHLHNCDACREDTEGLLSVLRLETLQHPTTPEG